MTKISIKIDIGYKPHNNLNQVYLFFRGEGYFPGASPGRGLLILHGYLNPGKSEHSEVQSPLIIAGASLCFMGPTPTDLKNMSDRQEHRDYKRIEWAFRSKSRDKLKHLMGAKSRSLIG